MEHIKEELVELIENCENEHTLEYIRDMLKFLSNEGP